MSEETALEPVLERPLAYLVRLGNLYAFTSFKGNRQLIVDGTLLLVGKEESVHSRNSFG